jgi:hypothetical protein
MKFTIASVFTLALGAQAMNVVRDLVTIQKVITDIQAQTKALNMAIKAYTTDYSALQSAATTLQNLIVSGTATVNAQPVLSLLDASQTAETVTNLSADVSSTVNALIANQATFVANGKAADVLKTLQDQKTASQALADALTSKVPSDLKEVANTLSAGINDALVKGIAAFNGLGNSPGSSAPWSSSVVSATSSASTISIASSTSEAWSSSSLIATSIASSSWSASATKTGSHTGHGSNTVISTEVHTSSAYATWSSPALEPSTVKATPAATYTGGAVARGVNGALVAAIVAGLVL